MNEHYAKFAKDATGRRWNFFGMTDKDGAKTFFDAYHTEGIDVKVIDLRLVSKEACYVSN